MMDLISRRKMLLTIPRCIATPGAVMPRAIPAAMPMKIQEVSDSRFMLHF
jgi:hypothetical protein